MGISEFDESYGDEQRVRGAILHDPVRDLEPHAPVCVRPNTTLREAIDTMNRVRLGCVLVTQGDRLVGILTERDVLRQVVGKLDLDAAVEKAMTPNPQTIRIESSIAFALNKMHVGGYRHLPVVDAKGSPVGVVSVRDVVRFIVGLFPDTVLNTPPTPPVGVVPMPGGA